MLKTTFTGNLLADPEIKYANNENGTAYARFRVGLNKKKGEENLFAVADVTTFKFPESANERLRRGSRVLINGDAFPSFYETNEGEIVAKLDVIADTWEDLEPRPHGNANQRPGNGNGHQHEPQRRRTSGSDQRNGNGSGGGNDRGSRTGNGSGRRTRSF
jgi:single-strand DNA-binding protein